MNNLQLQFSAFLNFFTASQSRGRRQLLPADSDANRMQLAGERPLTLSSPLPGERGSSKTEAVQKNFEVCFQHYRGRSPPRRSLRFIACGTVCGGGRTCKSLPGRNKAKEKEGGGTAKSSKFKFVFSFAHRKHLLRSRACKNEDELLWPLIR